MENLHTRELPRRERFYEGEKREATKGLKLFCSALREKGLLFI
jgi:hypothetical protein